MTVSLIVIMPLFAMGWLPSIRSVHAAKDNNNDLHNLFEIPLPYNMDVISKQGYSMYSGDHIRHNDTHTAHSAIGHDTKAGDANNRIASDHTMTKCTNSKPRGGTPHISRQATIITGTYCDDVIHGSNGGNIIFTLEGIDVVYGGKNNDIIYAGSGDGKLNGGDAKLYGRDGNDILVAGSGTTLADGGPADDVLLGSTGNDLLIGGSGDDKIFAGPGNSVMDGGPGADHFDCGPPTSAGRSAILDYNPSQGDTISGNCKVVNTGTY
jgi:Ca2+-binding RTX toxin-like protein